MYKEFLKKNNRINLITYNDNTISELLECYYNDCYDNNIKPIEIKSLFDCKVSTYIEIVGDSVITIDTIIYGNTPIKEYKTTFKKEEFYFNEDYYERFYSLNTSWK